MNVITGIPGTPQNVSDIRITPSGDTVRSNLGLLADLAGTWTGCGFNLIARPDAAGAAALYLQLNQTSETLTIEPIGSAIPNRGFGQGDIELYGLTYLQKISDLSNGGALHIEPGIWVVQPSTTYPAEQAATGSQIIARMGSIPHGNALLAQGTATPFAGTPVLSAAGTPYAFSIFPSFNSSPFPTLPPAFPIMNAAGTQEKLKLPGPPFPQYDLGVQASATNPRTPFGTVPPGVPLPAFIEGVPMQTVIDDPISLLQAVVQRQVAEGYSFNGVALNIATQAQVTFLSAPNVAAGSATTTVNVSNGAGGIENIAFLNGGNPVGNKGPNAQTALVYATFWIEELTFPGLARTIMQLQYAQMTILNFPLLPALPNVLDLGWPHISVATLRKSFH